MSTQNQDEILASLDDPNPIIADLESLNGINRFSTLKAYVEGSNVYMTGSFNSKTGETADCTFGLYELWDKNTSPLDEPPKVDLEDGLDEAMLYADYHADTEIPTTLMTGDYLHPGTPVELIGVMITQGGGIMFTIEYETPYTTYSIYYLLGEVTTEDGETIYRAPGGLPEND